MKRYDFASLEAMVLKGCRPRMAASGHPVAPSRLVADALGTSLQQVYRWRKIGVTADQADTLAVRVGLHSFEVWPALIDDGIEALRVSCAMCPSRFVRSGRRRYCSDRCRKRAAARRARRDPRRRAYNVEYLRAYREESRVAARSYARRYYRANRERLLAAQHERDRRRRAVVIERVAS